MSEIIPIVQKSRKSEKNTYKWDKLLHECEKRDATFLSVDAVRNSLLENFDELVENGVAFEFKNRDFDEHLEGGLEARWFAKIIKACGYRVLAEFVGTDDRFWVHMLSKEVHYFGYTSETVPKNENSFYMVPKSIALDNEEDIDTFVQNTINESLIGKPCLSSTFKKEVDQISVQKFRPGQRLELLSYNNSQEIRVARVQEVCGRRMNVLVDQKDYPRELEEPDDDRQAGNPDAQFWIDQGSFFIFPVGFAAVNDYTLIAKKDYVEHTSKIARAISKGEEPPYHENDITFEMLAREPIDAEKWSKLEVGQKFELLDPLSQQFKDLHVASILSFCQTNGYLIIGMDGPQAMEESFPIHVDNVCMFPVGYAEKYGLTLAPPDNFKGDFNWEEYLRKENAVAMPLEMFRPWPEQERMNKFEVGMHLEAADMCENQLICPATIKSIHGRLINVNFDGWDEEYDELYDIDSHDILPVGWCEFYGYKLQKPKT
ncbi:hypothetical protein L5515_010143 [Caenorhabditis briggsae]|uniref:Protein CBR-LIN-61 n=2 Tax=Caenorhabditis briggsae TaxID=6238 RepID=A0AAE9EST4_CAEBR|nr:hypothetical protein L5515_010143 [Caenorhabditis briggsae]